MTTVNYSTGGKHTPPGFWIDEYDGLDFIPEKSDRVACYPQEWLDVAKATPNKTFKFSTVYDKPVQ